MSSTFHKYIATHSVEFEKDKPPTRFSNAWLMPNNYCHSLAAFMKLVEEARKDFPKLKDEDVECLTVVHSSWCKGFPIIRFTVPADTKRAGWYDCERLPDIGT